MARATREVLARLSGWLRARNADLRRSSYVGFTATPFANIFIDPASTDEMLGDDLFPRDFIHVLAPPDNYVGMSALFPPRDRDDEAESAAGDMQPDEILRTIPDSEDWLPGGHKIDTEPGPLPDSLRIALRCFLLTCAIRDLQAADKAPGRGGGIHRSMLVNASRFTAVQNRIADALHLELEEIRSAVRLHGALPPEEAARQSPEIAALAEVFTTEFRTCGQAWPGVLAALHNAIAPVRVQPVNQTTGARSLDYAVTDGPPGVRVIAVGGNSLSRGLTLEGLSTSYFLRNARAYDTLMQMGRWFGYRDGYRKLCRLWLTEEAEGWYRHVTEATAELKSDFLRMKRRKATPREFGLRVRTHPGTLLITARNKMATGRTVDAVWDVSLMGRMIESSTLYSDRRRNEENLDNVDRFLGKIVSVTSSADISPHGGALVWHDIAADIIADFLDSFLVHPLNFDFQGDSIATLLREAFAKGDSRLSRWTVTLPTAGEKGRVNLKALPDVEVNAGNRKVTVNKDDSSLRVSGKSSRVGGRSDLRHAFSPNDFKEVTGGRSDFNEADVRKNKKMTGPLLIIYLLRGYEAIGIKPDIRKQPYRNGLVLPALGLHFPGDEGSNAAKNLVRYRLNRVAQGELLPAEFDEEESGDDADPDD